VIKLSHSSLGEIVARDILIMGEYRGGERHPGGSFPAGVQLYAQLNVTLQILIKLRSRNRFDLLT
jgi:hypothetical protein